MAQKKLMLLGGLRYLLPVIEEAHKLGIYVVTADYLPNNIAHKYSDEYVNVSVVDKEAVLAAAKEHQIDGIMSFAVDPGVVAASYVQEQLGLPSFGPHESVCILQNKDRFRQFLRGNGFNCPWSQGFGSAEDAVKEQNIPSWPCIVKPTDSAGSKGVTRVDRIENLKAAVDYAFKCSISGRVIIEEFLENDGCSSDTDSFLHDGQLKFVSFSAQRFDLNAVNPFTPSAFSWPSTFSKEQEADLTSELQRLFTLLKMKTSVFNIETRIANGKPYIMKATPRGGGNRLSEMLRYATGVDMIRACVQASVGLPVDNIEQKPYDGHWAEIILHADNNGSFDELITDEASVGAIVIERDLWVKQGDAVEAFSGANNAIGTLVVRFDTEKALVAAMNDIASWVKVKVKI